MIKVAQKDYIAACVTVQKCVWACDLAKGQFQKIWILNDESFSCLK